MSSDEEMHDSPLESPISSPTPDDRQKCRSCREKMKLPVVLSCLHVYCLKCLEKQVEEKCQDDDCKQSVIECEQCQQETPIPAKGLSDLLPEYVLTDLIEMSDIEDSQIVCTSCKAKEHAEARCQDCANFLCPNCIIAHQFMRCFENHKVITFEEMKKGNTSAVHRPIFCTVHLTENLKNYCKTCEVPICNDCIVSDHKPPEHQPERVQDLEEKEREYLKSIITESKSKIASCEEATGTLMSSLTELQSQRDNAKDLINETFQSYKAILEKRKDDLLSELDTLQSSKELSLMELCHSVEKATEKLEDGCSFTEHVLNNGSALQLLLMKKTISSQLLSLINNTPNPDVNVHIDFKTNSSEFEEAVKKTFGSFKKEEDIKTGPCALPERPLSSLHSSFENEGFNLHSGILSPDTTIMPPVHNDFMNMTPSITPGTIGEFSFPHSFSNMPPSAIPIGRSRSTIESRSHDSRSHSRNSHSPAMSDSGISVDAGSTNSNSSAPLVNIAALAKLGTVGYSAQGMGGCSGLADLMPSAPENSQVTINGHVVPGLNMSNISGMPPVSSRGPTPISEVGMPSNNRPQTPNLETLAGLLNRNNSSVLDTGNMEALGTFGLGASGGNITPNTGTLTPTCGLSDSTSSMNTIGSNQSGMMNMTTGPPVRRANKMSAMQIRCKFGQLGPGKGQFNSPHGFCLGSEEDIIVADTNNHRVQVFEKTGEFKYQFGIPGREEGQLWYPRKVAVMRNSGKFIVCDRGNERSRMQIFTKNGHFVKKIAIRYIDIVAGLAITSQGNIVAVDSVSPTVFVISEGGELIKWFDCSDYMREPSDIAISGKEYFVCDFKGHCVVVFNEEGHFQRRIGCENITNYPNGIDISDAGDVLVGDSHGNRFHVAVFQRDGSLIGEFECPYVKVSRCCGLKITSEGYVVTLAKNNHHVLVLNTLYIS
ncbi:B-box type zinc finger protein ncl-1-like isoform X2 [Ruditapes philippinarum]|uniref:B-box type zinc finger protein ncl-1-like isoform X2 n=1 Tax=Ruditapes philippinarum TaxID=129788 RepID=UPI00295BA3E4|nr:B-box type zinc finger protein ncl-1-like isoform X2 [Ruditapes philippinarum]